MRLAFFILTLLFSQHIFSQQTDKNYFVSPVKIPILLTGNFGELRSNHFHSGIDIKTQGKSGLPVYASADGTVSRINISPSGFGLALYIDHPNGTTTVYGHLSKLKDKLQKYARDIQHKRESFRVDLSVTKGKFKVKKGELIAYSGNSGSSGGPHLHFEIRKTSNQHPLNPLHYNFSVKDDMKPKMLSVMIYPLSNDAHVSSRQKPKRIETVYYDGAYHLKGNPLVSVYGDIGFGLQALDYLNGSWSKCGIYKIKLSVDGKVIYTFLLDELSFSETRFLNSHIDYNYYQTNWRRIHKNWLEHGNGLNNYHDVINRGITNLSDGQIHKVDYEIADVHGNYSKLSFKVKSKEFTIISKEENGYEVFHDQASTISKNDFSAQFKAGTFYSNHILEYEKKPSNNLFFSEIHKLHNTTIAVHQNYELGIKPINLPDSLQDKAIVVIINEKNRKSYSMGGSYENGWVKTKIRSLGTFAISVDTIAPTISSLSIRNKKNLIEKNRIRFKIKDNLSGISKYKGEIDGKWVLFEYDAKNNLIGYRFDPERFEFKKNHKLRLTVSDTKGNESVYEANFYK